MVTAAQGWVALGLCGGSFGLLITLVVLMVQSVSRELGARIDGLSGVMQARFDAVDIRIDNLDRDVQGLVTKVFRPDA